ncbi:MAG: hypothetical protein O7E52_05065 [Candidatus Poribacteria bacterium]|nr:hypothetical protein [Candidatus Poribacteria bacterium]
MNCQHIPVWFIIFLSISTVASAQQVTRGAVQILEANVLSILIGLVFFVAIGLPQVLRYFEEREWAELQKQIQDLGERLERQQEQIFAKLSQHEQEIEALKSRRIVTPS